jgi:hypothetical protein
VVEVEQEPAPPDDALYCGDGCGQVGEECPECRYVACRSCNSRGVCPSCWERLSWWTGREDEIAAWRNRPIDPNDDLAIIADYPDEVAEVREFQKTVRACPIYRVVDRIGGDLRTDFLAETIAGLEYDTTAAGDFFNARVCRWALLH